MTFLNALRTDPDLLMSFLFTVLPLIVPMGALFLVSITEDFRDPR